MTRISKDPDERRLELVNTAEKLFNEKGFDNTSVSDIVKSVGVAQGTFYYYFKSKDDIFNAIAENFLNNYMESFTFIVEDKGLGTLEKIEGVLGKGIEFMVNNEGVMFYLHTKGNTELHEKVEKKFIEYATPLAVKLVKQGVEEKLFEMEYPEEVVSFLLSGSHYLGDVNIYLEEREVYNKRIKAVEYVIRKVLGIDENIMEYFNAKYLDKLLNLMN